MNLQNLVDFYKIDNVDLFEDCTVPAPLDINLVKDNIMLRCGLLTPIYSEPYIFKQIVKMWFRSHQWTFEHLVKVLEADYSPIENVYESDHWTNQRSGEDTLEHGETHTLSGRDIDTSSGQDVDTLSGEDKETLGGKDIYKPGEVHTLGGTDSTENKISADNSSTYQPDNKSDTTYGRTDTASGTNTTEYGKTDTMKYGKTDTMAYGKTDTMAYGKTDTASGTDTTGYGLLETYDRLRHGNIGVTTNNQLINQELEMLENFEPYDWIARVFEEDNMLQVY